MPIKNGKKATRMNVIKALDKHKPFAAIPEMQIEVVLPRAYPDRIDYRMGPNVVHQRKHRALIRERTSGTILLTAPSTYALVEKIENGWKYDPNKKEGLFGRNNESQS